MLFLSSSLLFMFTTCFNIIHPADGRREINVDWTYGFYNLHFVVSLLELNLINDLILFV